MMLANIQHCDLLSWFLYSRRGEGDRCFKSDFCWKILYHIQKLRHFVLLSSKLSVLYIFLSTPCWSLVTTLTVDWLHQHQHRFKPFSFLKAFCFYPCLKTFMKLFERVIIFSVLSSGWYIFILVFRVIPMTVLALLSWSCPLG